MSLVAIALISAALLAYEVLLTRLFSIIQWHHFAYMVISIALLGYGASGTFLAFAQERLRPRFTSVFGVCAGLFAVSAVAAFAVAQRLPLNALAVVWEPRQLFFFLALYALFTVPFACGATCVGLALATFPKEIGRVYRSDLMGAGSGALGVMPGLMVLSPPQVLLAIAVLGFAAASLASLREDTTGRKWRAGVYLMVGVAAVVASPSWVSLRLSEYKGLSQALLVPGAEVLAERSTPLGLLTVVSSSAIPFRHVPGLSLNSPIEPPSQLGVFTDGDGLSAITAFDGRIERLAYLDYTTAALPYHLVERPRVLILGAGGGADVLLALYHAAAQVEAVELDPEFVRLVKQTYADFAGHLYDRAEVSVIVAEARGFVAGSGERYDLIELPLVDSFATAAGTLGLAESYIYTVEAIEAYLRHLRPGGYLAITRWLKLPPRDSLKLFATALEALARNGTGEPAQQLALLRSWTTTTLLVKNGPLEEREIARMRNFAEARSFDLAYYPGMQRSEADRFNILEQPYFFDGATALVGSDRNGFLDRYKFNLTPATDNRPYFFDFFKWRALPELLARRASGGAALLDWGYPILVATLVQAAALSLLLILMPLWFRRGDPVAGRWRVGVYFLAIGLAYLFVEIASIQRFILFLSHPLYATSVVLCSR
jgi:spermidine synthase